MTEKKNENTPKKEVANGEENLPQPTNPEKKDEVTDSQKGPENTTDSSKDPNKKEPTEKKVPEKELPKADEKPEEKAEAKEAAKPEAEAAGKVKVEEKSPKEKEAPEKVADKKEKAVKAVKEQEEDKIEEKHDDYDWEQVGDESPYSEKEQKEMEELYISSFNPVTENQVLAATVVSITESDVVLDIGFKSDGLVSLSEFRDIEDLKVGDEVDVYVAKKEDKKGQLVLSRKNAKLLKAWEQIVSAHETDEIVTGKIVSKTKGGLIADVFGLETFLPGSQIDVKPIIDYDAFVGKQMEFKVVKINETIKNAVVSHKALIESDLEEQRNLIISKLEKGQVLEGTIKNITDFGAFIDLGGVDGLLYITDISWGRINHPNEVLKLNQSINVVVLDFDDEKKRISLGLKQLTSHPWDVLEEDLKVGSKIKGKIVNIEDYGAFLEINPGVEGLIHVSEVSWSNQLINPKEYFSVGDEHEAIIVTLDKEERKMSLSIKQMTKDPWMDVVKKYSEGSRHKGVVKNIAPFGVFIEFDEGIGGMIHISDLSWTKKFRHPNEFTKVGEELDLVVLEIDTENRKLTLGHKQIEENPWDTFEKEFPIGSVHKATILTKDEKGSVVLLPYGLEAFAPAKHMKKEDGSIPQIDDVLEFKIIEFKADNKKVIVSHARIYEETDKEEKREYTEKKKKQYKQAKSTRKDIHSINLKVEKTTLGDIEALAGLKEQMEKADSPEETKEPPVPPKEEVAEKKEEVAPKEEEKKEEEKKEGVKAEEKVEATKDAKEDAKADAAPKEKDAPKKEAKPKAEKATKAVAKAKATPAKKAAKATKTTKTAAKKPAAKSTAKAPAKKAAAKKTGDSK